jgi:probable F420-dependent oxidoreductase
MAKQELKFSLGDYVGWTPDMMPLTEFAKLSEEMGFDGISLGDHAVGSDPSNEPLTVMTWAAAVTERIIVSSSVLVLPLSSPQRLAKQVANLDVLSNGRVILGVGVGGENSKEFEAFGVPVNERKARTDEYIEIMKGLWTQPKFTYNGKYLQCEDITLDPKPVQKPHPPLWIGGRMGGVETAPDGRRRFKSKTGAIKRAAKYGDGWLPNHMSPEQYKESVQLFGQFCTEFGRDLEQWPITFAHNISTLVKDSIDEALEEVVGKERYGEARDAQFALRYDIAGSPKDCISRISQFIDAGVSHFLLKIPAEREARLYQMKRLAKEVIPYFR